MRPSGVGTGIDSSKVAMSCAFAWTASRRMDTCTAPGAASLADAGNDAEELAETLLLNALPPLVATRLVSAGKALS